MRKIIALTLVPFMRVTGYRFSKAHRLNNSLVYRIVDTVTANLKAGL